MGHKGRALMNGASAPLRGTPGSPCPSAMWVAVGRQLSARQGVALAGHPTHCRLDPGFPPPELRERSFCCLSAPRSAGRGEDRLRRTSSASDHFKCTALARKGKAGRTVVRQPTLIFIEQMLRGAHFSLSSSSVKTDRVIKMK